MMSLFVSCLIAVLLSAAPSPSPSAPPDYNHWVGTYQWSELISSQPAPTWEYTLRVYRTGDQLLADVDIDGFQLKTHVLAICQAVKSDRLRFVYDRDRGDTTTLNFGHFKHGQVMLTLHDTGKQLHTEWGELSPQLRENRHNGVYFLKTSSK